MNRKQFLLSLPLIGLVGKLFAKEKKPVEQWSDYPHLMKSKQEMAKVLEDIHLFGRGKYRIDEVGLTRVDPLKKYPLVPNECYVKEEPNGLIRFDEPGNNLVRFSLEWKDGIRFGKVVAVEDKNGKFVLSRVRDGK
jgi:hypothetical protein